MIDFSVSLYKAQGYAGESVSTLEIRVDQPQPLFHSLDDRDTAYRAQAEVAEMMMAKALPGGLYDQLLVAMLRRKCTHFRVPHVEDGQL